MHCALYGKDFRTAGRHAYETFQQRGWTQIIGDSLIENTLSMLCFAMALVVCALGEQWRWRAHTRTHTHTHTHTFTHAARACDLSATWAGRGIA